MQMFLKFSFLQELKREREKVSKVEKEKKKTHEDLERDFTQRESELRSKLIEEKRYSGLGCLVYVLVSRTA